jgi:hypothetical protein
LFRIGNSGRKQRGKIYIPDPEFSVPLDDLELIMTFAAAEPITTLPLVSSPVPDWIFTSPPLDALPPAAISMEPPTELIPVPCPAERYMLPP